jgi:hypothetical protein
MPVHAMVQQLLESRPDQAKKLFRVAEQSELDKIGVDPSVPLAPVGGISLSASPLIHTYHRDNTLNHPSHETVLEQKQPKQSKCDQ